MIDGLKLVQSEYNINNIMQLVYIDPILNSGL